MVELSRPNLLDDGATPTPHDAENIPSNAVFRSQSFVALISAKKRVVIPLLVISFVYIFGVALLAGFAPGLMSLKITGSFNFGYLLVLGIYVLCWVVSVFYVNVANKVFEARSTNVAKEFAGDAS